MHEKVEYKGNEYSVKYKHDMNIEDKRVQAITTAFITEEDEIIAQGFAECSAKDQFSKKLGRRIAKGRMEKLLTTM